MEKTIEIEKKKVAYTLRVSKRARGVRLSVACGGIFTVTAPLWVRTSRIEAFILKKSAWVLDKIKYFSAFPKASPVRRVHRKKHFAEHREQARALVRERLAHFNWLYEFTWKRVVIRNQRSRWGSCSRARNLNFNYKLAFLPPHLADYIIVHELCHLGELNHSPRFWALVAHTLPEHQGLRKELKSMSIALN